MLRGEIGVEGDRELLVLFQRLLPGPATSSHRRSQAAGSTIMSDELVQILDGNTFVVSDAAATSRRR